MKKQKAKAKAVKTKEWTVEKRGVVLWRGKSREEAMRQWHFYFCTQD